MSEPDGDLLAMLQRARAVDEVQPDVEPHRRRKAKAATLSPEPEEEDVPTLVRTDISVEELEQRATSTSSDAEPVDAADRSGSAECFNGGDATGADATGALGRPPPISRLPQSAARSRLRLWALGIVFVVCVVGIALWLHAST